MQKFNRGDPQNIRSIYARRRSDRVPPLPEHEDGREKSLREYAVEQYSARLRKAEEDISVFSGLINQSNDALFVADAETGGLLYVNDKACACLHYSREELLGLNVREICSLGGTLAEWEKTGPALIQEDQAACETECRGKRGVRIPVEVTARRCRHSEKEYIILVARDIARQKESAANLLRVTRALRTLSKCNEAVAHAGDENALLQDICRIIVQHGGYRMAWVGYREDDDEKTVRPIACVGHDEGYLESAKVSWADTVLGGGPVGTAVRTGRPCLICDVQTDARFAPWRNRAVERSYFSVLALPLKLKGTAIGAISIYAREANAFDAEEVKLLEDLASNLSYGIMSIRVREEHKLAEKTLSQTLHELQSIMLAIPDILFRTDLDGNLVMWNKALETFTGLASRELEHRPAVSFFADRDRPAIAAALAECRSAGRSEVELPLFDKRRVPVLFNWKTVLMRDEKGNAVGTLGTARDITEHRRAEENERRLQAQLLQSQKMEAIGQLAGGIAHDFNNILTAIIGYGNIVLKKLPEADKMRVYVDNILSASNRAANLTRSLLTFSRKQPINPRPSNVNTIVEGVEKLLRRVIREDIELRTDLQPDIASVLVDSGQLEQVLINLATNARDAMPEGGTLFLSTRMAEIDERYVLTHGYGKTGKCVMITVSDTGTGMPEETKQRIFEPFFTTKDVGKGTGLGLSIAYGSIKQHNGYINVESTPGRGTTFRIYLPAVEETSREATPAEQLPAPPRGTETVLLAEDDATVRNLEKSMLEDSGYTVVEAVDGQDAIEKLRLHEGKIRLLISDVIMPKRSGGEVFEEAKRIRPGIKALFASGYPAEIIKNRDVIAQGLHFVSKPISPHDFLRKVREALDA